MDVLGLHVGAPPALGGHAGAGLLGAPQLAAPLVPDGQPSAARMAVLVGARPNLPKASILVKALVQAGLPFSVVHSGQHPPALGACVAAELGVPIDLQLSPCTGGSDPERVAALTAALGPVLMPERFSAVFVMGDVNTTLVGALVAGRQRLPVIHLEAGLRCGDECDPEELNRKWVTQCASIHLPSTVRAYGNLRAEGISADRIHFVGNSMAEAFLTRAGQRARSEVMERLGLKRGFVLFTVHKTPTVADAGWLEQLMGCVASLQRRVIFPCHPSLRRRWPQLLERSRSLGFQVIEPQPYDDLGRLVQESGCVVTDSAGLQEETTVAGVPCVTIGAPTARPETCEEGTNVFVGFNLDACARGAQEALTGLRLVRRPLGWDDRVSDRIVEALPAVMRVAREKAEVTGR
jgi:UDP-N-acetylglucosamine 2-epimerase (non-hydrolysing)